LTKNQAASYKQKSILILLTALSYPHQSIKERIIILKTGQIVWFEHNGVMMLSQLCIPARRLRYFHSQSHFYTVVIYKVQQKQKKKGHKFWTENHEGRDHLGEVLMYVRNEP
jgi:hypothetical protein